MLVEPDLDRAALAAALRRGYGLAASAVRFLPVGETAWCYQVTDEHGGRWFLKLARPGAIEPGRAEFALQLGRGLAELGLPVPRPQPVGEARRFAKSPKAPGVIPNFARARQLYEKDARAFDGMAFGLARPDEPSRFAYAFGNPTVVPQGPRYASCKSAGLAIVTLGALQVWVVDPTIFHAAKISFPKRVIILEPGLKYSALRGMPVVPRLEAVVVDNGEHDIVELIDRLNAWARTRSSG